MSNKDKILLYNIDTEEKQKIQNIFKSLNIDNEIIEDIIRGWVPIFFIDKNFFDNIEQLKKKIQNYYDESKTLKIMYNYTSEFIKDGIIGFSVGDTLGVPAEFKSREELKNHPITNMV